MILGCMSLMRMLAVIRTRTASAFSAIANDRCGIASRMSHAISKCIALWSKYHLVCVSSERPYYNLPEENL